MSRDVKIVCPKCGGKGICHLPKRLASSLDLMKWLSKKTPAFLVSDFQEFHNTKSGDGRWLNIDTAHHRIRRLVKLGLVERIQGKGPARYSVAKLLEVPAC